jgi:hypothetical protein
MEMKEWCRTVVGPLPDGGIQVWCNRCSQNVFLVSGAQIVNIMKELHHSPNKLDPTVAGRPN